MGTGVTEIGPGHVTLSDGSTIKTRCVVWGGGLMAAPVAGAAGLPQGRGGRIDVNPDFTVEGFPGRARDRRHREHPGQGRQDPPAARVGRAPERLRGGQDDPRRPRGQDGQAVLVPRQGDDGDDRPRRGRRPGQGRGAARQGRVRRLARRPRRADDGRQQPRRRVQELGRSTSSARNARPRRSTGAARRAWSGKRTRRSRRRHRQEGHR